jgi:uncharacterized protein (DUF2252 family)
VSARSGPAKGLQPAESADRGRAARADAPRSSHGEWQPAADRPDPVDVLVEQAATRVPELVPIRYGRMLVSPFAFFRGAAAVMAADLAPTPTSGLTVQLCGDAHISNFGGFAAPDRRLIFDLNDFDETLPGPWEWDVKRMAASIEIAGRDRGAPAAKREAVVQAAMREYRKAMRGFAEQGNLAVWYARMDLQGLEDRFGADVGSAERRRLAQSVAKARRKDSLRALTKLTHRVGGRLRFLSEPPLLQPVEELLDTDEVVDETERMTALLAGYAETLPHDCAHLLTGYRYVHLARKVVGVGSVGTRAWIILLEGRDTDDPLVLQAKEAVASVLEPYAGASAYDCHGERVVEGQRLMQAAGDIFLGWQHAPGVDQHGHDFYLRQLWDGKASGDVATMTETGFATYMRTCAWSLARAHARTGDRLAISAYLGSGATFDKAIARFASAYADQNERDHAALAAAVEEGRVEAQHGV